MYREIIRLLFVPVVFGFAIGAIIGFLIGRASAGGAW
jgi:hypothetical protein